MVWDVFTNDSKVLTKNQMMTLEQWNENMRAVKSLGKCWKLILSHLDLCTYACSSQEMHNQEMHDGVPCIDQLSSNALKQFQSHYILQGRGDIRGFWTAQYCKKFRQRLQYFNTELKLFFTISELTVIGNVQSETWKGLENVGGLQGNDFQFRPKC